MKKRQALWLLTPPLLLIIALFIIWNFWAREKLINYAISQVPRINSMQNIVDLSIDQLDISLLKLQLRVGGVKITFKNHFEFLNKAQIDNIKLQVDPFNLLVGQLSASYVRIDSLQWQLPESAYKKLFQSSSGPNPEINLEPVFKLLPDIPLQSIYIVNSWTRLPVPDTVEHSIKQISLNVVSLQVFNQKKSVEVNASQISLGALSDKNVSSSLEARISAKLDVNSIKKLSVEVIKNSTSIKLSMTTQQLRTLLIKPQVDAKVNAQFQLDEVRNLAYVVKNSDTRLPQMAGDVTLSGSLKTDGFNKNEGSLSLMYSNINIETFKFGSGEFNTKIKNNQFDVDNIKIEHPSGLAELKNINFENRAPYKFKTDILVNEFNLQKLFLSINKTNIPAFLGIKGRATCEGQVDPFMATCLADVNAENIDVYTNMKKSLNIVSIKKVHSTISATINPEELNFKNTLEIGPSSVQAEGKINFKNGFDFHFKSDGLNLDDIQNIAELKLKGLTKGTLNTSGDSEAGVIDARLNITKSSIDDFDLGDISTSLEYKKGVIKLDSLEGKMGASIYTGNIDVDVDKSLTQGNFKFTELKVTDALAMIENKWHLPIVATGQGQAQVLFNGPLDFWKLNMQITASLNKGSLYDESFSKLDAHLEADGQKMIFKNFKLSKTTGWVELSDYIETKNEPQLNLKISSHNLKADDIDHLNMHFKNISGDVQINGKIIGHLDNPKIITQNQLNHFQIESYKLPNSQIESELNKKFFHGSGQIFGRQIQTDFKIPLAAGENFNLKAKLNDFQTLLLLPLIGLSIPDYDVKSNLSANIDLTSARNSIDQLNGKITLEQFFLERGQQTLKLTAPSEIIYRDRLTSMSPLNIVGPDQNLSIKLKNHNGQQKIFTSGRLFLKPLQFLVPFTETMSGIMEFSTYIRFSNGRPEFSGEGLINDASFSMKGFPYPVSNTSAFFDLYGSKVDFTEISATLNQTRLFGLGTVDIKGPKNIKVDLGIDSEELELDFPSKIFTSGLAKINFSGDWLPYTLKIDYDILQGLVTKEFSKGDDDSIMVLQPNSLLPTSQLDTDAQTLLFDIKTKFNKGLVVKNSILEGLMTGYVNITGTPSAPIYAGQINVQPGSKLNFKDKPFDIQNGLVKFNSTKEIGNAEVTLSANARVADYDIALNVNGLAKKLDIKATSQPSLSDNDIFSLLALGYISTDQNLPSQNVANQSLSSQNSVNQNLSSDVQQKQTGLEVLSAIGNQSEFSKKIQSRLGLNVQLAPSIDSTRNIAVPKVIVSKQLGKKLNTSYSRSLTGDRQNNEVKLQWLFRPDTSVILNYQNQPNLQENNILLNQENEIGVGGFDIEYKKEFQ